MFNKHDDHCDTRSSLDVRSVAKRYKYSYRYNAADYDYDYNYNDNDDNNERYVHNSMVTMTRYARDECS